MTLSISEVNQANTAWSQWRALTPYRWVWYYKGSFIIFVYDLMTLSLIKVNQANAAWYQWTSQLLTLSSGATEGPADVANKISCFHFMHWLTMEGIKLDHSGPLTFYRLVWGYRGPTEGPAEVANKISCFHFLLSVPKCTANVYCICFSEHETCA